MTKTTIPIIERLMSLTKLSRLPDRRCGDLIVIPENHREASPWGSRKLSKNDMSGLYHMFLFSSWTAKSWTPRHLYSHKGWMVDWPRFLVR